MEYDTNPTRSTKCTEPVERDTVRCTIHISILYCDRPNLEVPVPLRSVLVR